MVWETVLNTGLGNSSIVERLEVALARFRRNIANGSAVRRMCIGINRFVCDLVCSGVRAEKVAIPSILRRPDRPWPETSAAVWTHVLQNILNTGRAKRAFIRANARF